MNTYFLRCRQSDVQTLIARCVTLGSIAQQSTEDGIIATDAIGGSWDEIGPIYRPTGDLDESGLPIALPVSDHTGALWHANLVTPVDLIAASTSSEDLDAQGIAADPGRWMVVDGSGMPTAPNSPHRLPAGWQPPAPPAPPRVPPSVTMRQARLALLGIGKLAHVTTAIAAIPDALQRQAAQIEWEYSATVERNRPFVQMLAPALGLTSAQLDQLFIEAAKL